MTETQTKSVSDIRKLIPKGKTFTLIAGCFDLLHVGHISLLEYASNLEDILVVAVLSDRNISEYKPGRPIINERQRSTMIASVKFVDLTYISDINPNGPETIEILQPNSVVFGQDTSSDRTERWKNTIRRCSPCTRIHIFPRYTEEDVCTSQIIEKIKNTNI